MRTVADDEEDRTPEIVPQITPRADWRVADVQALPGYRLRVRFNDATEGEVDMSQLIQPRMPACLPRCATKRFSERCTWR